MSASSLWQHVSVEFTDRDSAERHVADRLVPVLDRDPAPSCRWWFLRKTPGWRIRYEPAPAQNGDAGTTAALGAELADLTADGAVTAWTFGIYEPETLAFGGAVGMDIAHTLFHADSRHLITSPDPGTGLKAGTDTEVDHRPSGAWVATGNAPSTSPRPEETWTRLGRRETTVVLFTALLRAAGLDWFEQGDVWDRVAGLRPQPPVLRGGPERAATLTRAVRHLMNARPDSLSELVAPSWTAAFEVAGRELAVLDQRGELLRGLRGVAAHHFLFHANRAGLSSADQAALAALATDAVFHTRPTTPSGQDRAAARTGRAATTPGAEPVSHTGEASPTVRAQPTTPPRSTSPDPDSVEDSAMINTQPAAHLTGPAPDSDADAEVLRRALVDKLRRDGVLSAPDMAAATTAMLEVPRHLYLPGIPLADAYADEAVYTKHDDGGVSLSAASQPGIVAMMLGQLDVQPGDRVLEVGAGTGYNAHLLRHQAGDTGQVWTIDVDDDLVAGARAHLHAAGAHGVEVICADGALGHPDAAPFDRVVATVGAAEIPPAWLDQLAPDGPDGPDGQGGGADARGRRSRLVAPLRLAGAVSRSVAFERDGSGGWVSRNSEMNTFMPLRGIGDDPRTVIDLTGTGDITLQAHADNAHATDPAALVGVLHTPAHTVWTGVHFVSRESFEWLDLWLACHLPNPLMRITATPETAASDLVALMFGSAAMATTSASGALAYLTIRAAGTAPDPAPAGTRSYEVGVTGHGPRADRAAVGGTDALDGPELAELVGDHIREWDRRARSCQVSITVADPAAADTAGSCGDDPHVPGHVQDGAVIEQVQLHRPHTPMTLTWSRPGS